MQASLIWNIQAPTGPEHYLVGTAHIGEYRTVPILNKALPILDRCTHFYAESHLGDLKSVSMPQLDPGLTEQLSAKHYAKAKRMMKKAFGLDLERFERVPPILTVQECASAYLRPVLPALDQSLWHAAIENGLSCDGLESAMEQMGILQTLPISWQIRQLQDALAHVKKFKRGVNQMLSAYQRESIQTLYKQSYKSLGAMRDVLLFSRNQRMADKIEMQITRGDEARILFSMGAAHLAGYHGVLRNLKLRGYKISPHKSCI